MGLNPTKSKTQKEWKDTSTIGLEGAEVTRTEKHTQGDNISHAVYVRPDTMEQDVIADVAISQTGDVEIPVEGSRVVIGYRPNGRPLVLDQRYNDGETIPDFEPGERIVGHPLSESYIKLAKDGSVTVEGDGGNTIQLQANGDVVINGGTTQAITDVSAGSTNSNNGITSLDITRSPSVYLPSQ